MPKYRGITGRITYDSVYTEFEAENTEQAKKVFKNIIDSEPDKLQDLENRNLDVDINNNVDKFDIEEV